MYLFKNLIPHGGSIQNRTEDPSLQEKYFTN